jgi:predicted MFS family arabinose efflux permease
MITKKSAPWSQNLFSLLKKSSWRLFFLAAGMFAMGFEDYLFAGLLPGVSHSLHSSVVAVAQGCAAFGVAYIASMPLCAFLLSKKSAGQVLVWALLTFIAGNAATLVSPNVMIYVASRFVAGLGSGLYLPIAVAAATHIAGPESKGRALGLLWGANSIGAVVGVPLGLWLAERMGWQFTVVIILLLAAFALAGVASSERVLEVQTAPPSLRAQFRLLADLRVLAVVGVTLLTATGCLGLYAYISQVLAGSPNSSEVAFSLWSIGGLFGSVISGFVIDRKGDPRILMTILLVVLFVVIISIPSLRGVPVLGLLPFPLWGAMGWASVTPQQYRLIQMRPGHEAILVALNSSAVSLGSAFGTLLGGMALTGGFAAERLPYLTAIFVVCALMGQLLGPVRRLL